MLQPIPGVMPATAQQDVPKPRPDVPPVAPPQAGVGSSGVGSDEHAPVADRRRRQRPAGAMDEAEDDVEELGEAPRKGQWIDIEC
ncbi:hypothetical protein D9M68_293140 [compost metagenome]|uniref:Aspartate-semialdehyde dehydrogenase n=1 Tax=Pseudomonas jinjuensis TaxID=198616 RepID=A0A1H0M955_9PSED|nr:hypothetical protein [Pseudomonas jinjuensis]SDO76821.1 hypothetical protein SAMN05216193_115138 [Pseudomonas jinjuensis]